MAVSEYCILIYWLKVVGYIEVCLLIIVRKVNSGEISNFN